MAESVFRRYVEDAGLADHIAVDSAGTGGWHVGDDADPRAAAALAERGYATEHCARKFNRSWFAERDLIVALDRSHYHDLLRLAPDRDAASKVVLLRSFDPRAGDDLDVPDPYYGHADHFEEVLDMVESACAGLLDEIRPLVHETREMRA
jgi:protein-tyrosine phosphatase